EDLYEVDFWSNCDVDLGNARTGNNGICGGSRPATSRGGRKEDSAGCLYGGSWFGRGCQNAPRQSKGGRGCGLHGLQRRPSGFEGYACPDRLSRKKFRRDSKTRGTASAVREQRRRCQKDPRKLVHDLS